MWYTIDMTKDAVKQYYESNRISFAELARQSSSIFGFEVTLDQIKKWSQEDNGWHKPSVTDTERLKIIANKIFEAIEEEDLNPKDLAALANTYLAISTKAPAESMDKKPTLQQIIDTVKNVE